MQPTGVTIYLIQHLAAVIEGQANQLLLERLGVSFAKYKVLMTIRWYEQGISQRYIADTLSQTEASISRQVKLLLDKGLVVSSISSASRRDHLIQISHLGLRIITEAQSFLDAKFEPLLAMIDKKSQRHLESSLAKLHQILCPDENQACRLLAVAIR